MEREAARRHVELERQRLELEEQNRRRLLLQEETERRQQELDEEFETQRQLEAYNNLRAEVQIREREELRSILGSDYESDDGPEDVTRKQVPRRDPVRFQSDDDQQAMMHNILTDMSKPKPRVDVADMTQRRAVENWLDDSREKSCVPPKVPLNTPAGVQDGYPQSKYEAGDKRDGEPPLRDARLNLPIRQAHDTSIQSKSDTALFSRVLRENRLPKPKMMTFDGDPKRYKMFMASFRSNVDEMLEAGDEKLKLTLLLDQCTGKAFELIEECVMLRPDQGYRTAIEKLEKRFGKNHLIARSYIDGVKKGGPIKANDVEAIVKLADDMRKCQNVLSELRFASDLDSTGTIESIIDRLPEAMQNQWVKRSNKILNMGREPAFRDLTTFVEERADDFNSKYGQYVAEKRCSSSKPKQQDHAGRSRDRKRNVTTLATSTETSGSSTAGLDTESTCASTSTTQDTKKPKCLQCERTGHYITTCYRFKKLSLQDKRDIVKKHNLCYCCLQPGHGSNTCERVCTKCSKKHHYHLHEDKADANKPVDDKKQAAAAGVVASTFKDRGRASLGVLRVRVQNEGREIFCWALVDSGSNTTFIKRSIADKLGINGPDHVFSVNTLGGAVSHDEMCVDFILASEDGTETVHVEGAFTLPSLGIKAKYDGTTHANWKHLADLNFPAVEADVEIIIGTDCTEMFWSDEERRGGRKEPMARKTILGWILLGPTEHTRTISANAAAIEPIDIAYDKMLMADFEDVKHHEPVMSVDDKRALKTMQETVHLSEGKFCVGIPWKINPEEALQNNRSMAESRLRMLKRKFQSNSKLAEEYTKTVEAYIEEKQAVLVEEDDLNTPHQWFLPHHCVFKRSNPEKCRVVFDCAAQYKGVSLNDAILQGPNFLNNLSGVLIRFRKEPVAVVGDIKLMFHQCFVLEQDSRFLRFLWWPNGDTTQKPKVYCMRVHLFGGKSSPSVVNFCMRQIASNNEDRFSELSIDTLRRSFYMDDMIRSVSTVAEAKALIPEMQSLLQTGGFDLGKFMSTSRDVIETVPENQRAKSLHNIDLHDNTLPQESALGLKWDVENDCFTYSVNLQEKPLTKRGLLGTTASLYDPLGLVAPVLLVPKLMQQELCRKELDWDDPIPADVSSAFCKWRDDTTALSKLQIQRCLQDGPSASSDKELHIFTDASECAYGAAAYLKVTTETSVHVSLVMGKSRVAPLKSLSIPRLELTAATVGAKLSKFILDEFDMEEISLHFWTDSMTVLRYLRNVSSRFKVFVAHRVQQIQDLTDVNSWNYVPTDKNPADLSSRGINPSDTEKLTFWLKGPQFLRTTTEYDRIFEEPKDTQLDLELRTACAAEVCTDVGNLISHYSSIRRLQKAVVWLFKFAKYLRGADVSSEITVKDMENALTALVKYVQQSTFKREITSLRRGEQVATSSLLSALTPILVDGMICVGGRLENADGVTKHPVVLPKHHFTRLIIRDVHERNAHIGSNQVIATLHKKYHVVKAYSQVKSALNDCIECKKHHAKPAEQMMASLPRERVEADNPPFTYVGVDYFGPMLVKYRRGTVKRYGCLFTCMVTRAVHIEVTHSLDSNSFLMALHRFMARRGKPTKIFSDNGTNFVAADRELAEEIQAMNSKKLRDELVLEAIEWQFNPPHAPHMGGVWERIVRSVKGLLRTLVGERLLNDEELVSFICEAERILNDRPLTRMGSDVRDVTPLTPNHLLLLKANDCSPNTEANHVRRRWQTVQEIANRFYQRFTSEYIPTLQRRTKWASSKENLRVNDIVLVADEE